MGELSPEREGGEGRRSEGSTALSFALKPHAMSMAVWDVPSPVATAEKVKVRIGAKCIAGCELAGCKIEVYDRGRTVGGGNLGGSPFPGTSALYWAEVEFVVPNVVGYHEFEAKFKRGGPRNQHEEASYKFGLMVAARVLHKMTVSVADSLTKAPLDSAYVRIGAYTAFTDKEGVARLSVADANYEIVAWKRNHQMFRSTVDVARDDEIRVELVPAPCKYCPDST